jgi:hypothetical protein
LFRKKANKISKCNIRYFFSENQAFLQQKERKNIVATHQMRGNYIL